MEDVIQTWKIRKILRLWYLWEPFLFESNKIDTQAWLEERIRYFHVKLGKEEESKIHKLKHRARLDLEWSRGLR